MVYTFDILNLYYLINRINSLKYPRSIKTLECMKMHEKGLEIQIFLGFLAFSLKFSLFLQNLKIFV